MEMNRKKVKKIFRDQRGKEYKADKLLGEGGQGVVWELEGGKYAAKVVKAKDRLAAERLAQRFKIIQGMDLGGLPVAKPLLLLQRPEIGYIMEVATGMVPLKTLLQCPSGTSLVEWYLATGGVRRRLSLLIRLSEVLAELHARGIIYGDLSPQNVFISADIAYSEVFLIDLDNLRIVTKGNEYIYTPEYGAPEIIKGAGGISSLSDCFSFAVIAFRLLCLAHPLIGDYVNVGEPELEELALRGEIPWVWHASDTINSLSSGLPMQLVTSSRMQTLFARAFEAGLSDPTQRPGMNEWREVLEIASDGLIACPTCGGSYFFDSNEPECRFCDEKQPEVYYAFIKNWEPREAFHEDAGNDDPHVRLFNSKAQTQGVIVLGEGDEKAILSRHIQIVGGSAGREALLSIRIDDDKVSIEAGNGSFWLSRKLTERSKSYAASTVIPLAQLDKLAIHFEPLSQPQRIVYLRKYTKKP